MRRPAPAIEPVSAIPSNSAAFPGPIGIEAPSRRRMRGSNLSFIHGLYLADPAPIPYFEAAGAKNEALAGPRPTDATHRQARRHVAAERVEDRNRGQRINDGSGHHRV